MSNHQTPTRPLVIAFQIRLAYLDKADFSPPGLTDLNLDVWPKLLHHRTRAGRRREVFIWNEQALKTLKAGKLDFFEGSNHPPKILPTLPNNYPDIASILSHITSHPPSGRES